MNDGIQTLGRRHRCNHCGGTASPVAIWKSREGKTFRILTCINCEEGSWAEES